MDDALRLARVQEATERAIFTEGWPVITPEIHQLADWILARDLSEMVFAATQNPKCMSKPRRMGRCATLRVPRWLFPIIDVVYPAALSLAGSSVMRRSTPALLVHVVRKSAAQC